LGRPRGGNLFAGPDSQHSISTALFDKAPTMAGPRKMNKAAVAKEMKLARGAIQGKR
jgi:hypothetical protein